MLTNIHILDIKEWLFIKNKCKLQISISFVLSLMWTWPTLTLTHFAIDNRFVF